APLSPDYIPGPEHADDEIVAKDEPYAEDASPISQSPEYVPESDFEMHPEDDDDEDPEEDPVDYPANGGDDGDDEEGSSEDEEDDEMDVEADEEEEEEEHPAPADSVVVAPTATDQAPYAEETEPFETDESKELEGEEEEGGAFVFALESVNRIPKYLTLDLLSIIDKHSRKILSRKLPPAAESRAS
nr:hypothetical protein [Tanacetum cinerariifolium]